MKFSNLFLNFGTLFALPLAIFNLNQKDLTMKASISLALAGMLFSTAMAAQLAPTNSPVGSAGFANKAAKQSIETQAQIQAAQAQAAQIAISNAQQPAAPALAPNVNVIVQPSAAPTPMAIEKEAKAEKEKNKEPTILPIVIAQNPNMAPTNYAAPMPQNTPQGPIMSHAQPMNQNYAPYGAPNYAQNMPPVAPNYANPSYPAHDPYARPYTAEPNYNAPQVAGRNSNAPTGLQGSEVGGDDIVIPNAPMITPSSIIEISAIGMGVAPESTLSPAQALALAKRAAIVDAYRQIGEKMYGIRVNAQDTVRDMVLKNSTVKTKIAAVIRNAEIVETVYKDGLCQVSMELKLDGKRWYRILTGENF